jgi:hypothetical protein
MQSFMTRLEIQARIRVLRDELENRHKTGIIKMAQDDGVTPIPTDELQNELYNLIYKLSKFE